MAKKLTEKKNKILLHNFPPFDNNSIESEKRKLIKAGKKQLDALKEAYERMDDMG
ncbi:MAG: hypothetical protein QM791_10835 [Ferruginibacter sp.]